MAEAVHESVPGSRAAGERRKVVQRLEEGRHRLITLPTETEDCAEWEEHLYHNDLILILVINTVSRKYKIVKIC